MPEFCCAAPQQSFTVRNDGQPPLASDTRVTITMPAGVISPEGIREIRYCLFRAAQWSVPPDDERRLVGLGWNLAPLGEEWQTRTGNYTKRLSRHAYKEHELKLSPEILSEVGCIARDHSKPVDFTVEVTRDLNRSSRYFGNHGSCWWGCYKESRCALKTNGGFALRSFGPSGEVSGRAWVMPLRLDGDGNLVPTFDTVTPDAFVLFNGYGELGNYTGARVMASMAGWTYKKIGFECEPMYINAGGYLIAPEETAQNVSALHLSVEAHSDLSETEKEELSHVA